VANRLQAALYREVVHLIENQTDLEELRHNPRQLCLDVASGGLQLIGVRIIHCFSLRLDASELPTFARIESSSISAPIQTDPNLGRPEETEICVR
jgi:hypothetical protein